jgi:hypothetical protein
MTDDVVTDASALAGLDLVHAEDRIARGKVAKVALAADEDLAGRRVESHPTRRR